MTLDAFYDISSETRDSMSEWAVEVWTATCPFDRLALTPDSFTSTSKYVYASQCRYKDTAFNATLSGI